MSGPQLSLINKSSVIATIGVVVEFYDYLLFGYLTATWHIEFFPGENQTLSLIFIWSTFAVGMAMRPVGGIFFGYFGTKFGRKSALRLSVILMSLPMLVVGLTPGYATIGIIAPIIFLLMRMVQGFSVGGEYSGTIVYLAEIAPHNRRGMVTNTANGASGLGALLASIVVLILNALLTDQQLHSWGWRIAYLVGGVMVVLAIIMRSHMKESEYYEKAVESGDVPTKPLRAALKHDWRQVLEGIVITGYAVAIFYFALSYLPSFLENQGGKDSDVVLIVASILAALFAFTSPLWGLLADHFGRRIALCGGSAVLFIFALPAFWLLQQHSTMALVAGGIILLIPVMAFWGGFSPWVVELFSAEHRFSGMGISYNLGAGILGGTVGVIITATSAAWGNLWGPIVYLVPFSAIAFVLSFRSRETAFVPLDDTAKHREAVVVE